MIDTELLRRVAESIRLGEAGEVGLGYSQDLYHPTSCESACCVAGHTIALVGELGLDDYNWSPIIHDDAQNLLGLSIAQADALFCTGPSRKNIACAFEIGQSRIMEALPESFHNTAYTEKAQWMSTILSLIADHYDNKEDNQ